MCIHVYSLKYSITNTKISLTKTHDNETLFDGKQSMRGDS